MQFDIFIEPILGAEAYIVIINKLRLKVTHIYFARHCQVNLFKMIEMNLRPRLTPAEAGTHFTDNWKPESSLSAPGIEPRPSRSTC